MKVHEALCWMGFSGFSGISVNAEKCELVRPSKPRVGGSSPSCRASFPASHLCGVTPELHKSQWSGSRQQAGKAHITGTIDAARLGTSSTGARDSRLKQRGNHSSVLLRVVMVVSRISVKQRIPYDTVSPTESSSSIRYAMPFGFGNPDTVIRILADRLHQGHDPKNGQPSAARKKPDTLDAQPSWPQSLKASNQASWSNRPSPARRCS